MVQNMMMAALTSLQNMDEVNRWDNRPFSGVWPEPRTDNFTDIKRTIKKKPKRIRTAYTTEQLKTLEQIFTQSKYITSEYCQKIAMSLNVTDKSIKIWFQNRRMKLKKSSESGSDSSNETSVGEMSPPPLPRTDLQNSMQVITHTPQSIDNQEEHHLKTSASESCQYQAPPFYVNYGNDEVVQTGHTSANINIPAASMPFYNDSNGFPTQYYPYYENNHINNYNYEYYQCQQQNAMDNNYCSSSNDVDFCYFFN